MKFRSNQTGMSLIEVMIAVTILSGISLSVIMLSKNMDKSVNSAELKADIQEVTREISQIMDNKDHCTATVYGASGSSNTILSSIKLMNNRNQIVPHARLQATSTTVTASTPYVGKGIIINGMYLKHRADHAAGANYELRVTFIKSVKAAEAGAGGTKARDTFYGQNAETKIIPLQLDNCQRFMVTTPQNGTGAPISAAATCVAAGGTVVGDAVYFTSATATLPDSFATVGCRICSLARTTVKGCI